MTHDITTRLIQFWVYVFRKEKVYGFLNDEEFKILWINLWSEEVFWNFFTLQVKVPTTFLADCFREDWVGTTTTRPSFPSSDECSLGHLGVLSRTWEGRNDLPQTLPRLRQFGAEGELLPRWLSDPWVHRCNTFERIQSPGLRKTAPLTKVRTKGDFVMTQDSGVDEVTVKKGGVERWRGRPDTPLDKNRKGVVGQPGRNIQTSHQERFINTLISHTTYVTGSRDWTGGKRKTSHC